jgi:hypothetical protein
LAQDNQPRTGARRWVPRTGSERIVVGLLAALFGMTIADLVDPNRPGLLVLILAPLLAAVLLRPRATATLSVVCVLLALTLPGSLYEAGAIRFIRVAAIAGISVMAIVAAIWRQRLTSARLDLLAQRASLERDRRAALEVNDAILQDVFTARMWMVLGRQAEASQALTRALESTSGFVGSLLGDSHIPRAGELVRRDARAGGRVPTA